MFHSYCCCSISEIEVIKKIKIYDENNFYFRAIKNKFEENWKVRVDLILKWKKEREKNIICQTTAEGCSINAMLLESEYWKTVKN